MKRWRGSASEEGLEPPLSISPRVESRWRKAMDAFPESLREELLQKVSADRKSRSKSRSRGRRVGTDITWVTDRIGVGGGIWNADNMAAVARAGVTHIIDMQIEFDDTPLAEPHGIAVCWNPVDDDFEPKT